MGLKMSDDFLEIMKLINAPEVVPPKCYRRNSIAYPLICYVNNITGCYISKNFDAIPIFIERARLHMDGKFTDFVGEEYCNLVARYLDQMENYLLHLDCR
jgi:hypothetical protein